MNGKYIVIEGSDGTGKSTQIERLAARLQRQGIKTVTFHEPDGVAIASQIRTIIKNGTLTRSALTNLLLFTACRHENWQQVGQAALQQGTWGFIGTRLHLNAGISRVVRRIGSGFY